MSWLGRGRIAAGALLAFLGVAASASAWYGEQPLLSHPEASLLLIMVGSLVLVSGIWIAFAIVVRAVAGLGIAHLVLTLLTPAGAAPSPPAAAILTLSAFAIAFGMAWTIPPRSFAKARRDAILFAAAGALVTAIAVRDSLGPDFSPYGAADVGLWFLVGLGLALAATEIRSIARARYRE